jgi:hypothetical protein
MTGQENDLPFRVEVWDEREKSGIEMVAPLARAALLKNLVSAPE